MEEAMNLEALGDLMDGKGELAGAIANAPSCTRIAADVQQLRFLHTVRRRCPRSGRLEPSVTPLNNLGLIRIKAHVALRVAAQSGLLS
jgi:hypothetical protein